MSANRANAAARNRRAGGAEMPPPQQSNVRPGQSQKSGQKDNSQIQNPKISISDAIGLVSLRIGRLEQFMYKINSDGISSNDYNIGDNDRIIDEDVFRSIVSRIESLEQKISSSQNQNNEVKIDDHPLIKILGDKQNLQQMNIYEIKDMILKMQTFIMETNTGLKAMIEQYESDKLYIHEENIKKFNNEGFDETQIIIHENNS